MFDWEDLRHFLALAQSGTLSGASRVLGVDHATVGRRVSSLEASMGVRLLDRLPRRVTLTAAGARLFDLATTMESAAFAIERAMRAEQAGLSGRVVVSAPPVLVAGFLAPAAAQVRAAYPDIDVVFSSEPASVSLNKRHADIAVRMARPIEQDSVPRLVGRMEFSLYGAPGYTHIARPELFEFIAYDEAFDAYPHQKAILARAGRQRVVFRTTDIASQLAATAAGVGVAVLPRFLAETNAALVCLDRDAGFIPDLWLAVHGDLRHAPAIAAVANLLADAFSDNAHLRRP